MNNKKFVINKKDLFFKKHKEIKDNFQLYKTRLFKVLSRDKNKSVNLSISNGSIATDKILNNNKSYAYINSINKKIRLNIKREKSKNKVGLFGDNYVNNVNTTDYYVDITHKKNKSFDYKNKLQLLLNDGSKYKVNNIKCYTNVNFIKFKYNHYFIK